MVPNAVENHILTLPTFGEILLGVILLCVILLCVILLCVILLCVILLCVINDVICADGSHHLHISRAAYAGHIRAERLGDLHRERTHASRRTVNQDLVLPLNLSLVA